MTPHKEGSLPKVEPGKKKCPPQQPFADLSLLHPFLFAALPVLFLLSHNIHEIWSATEPILLVLGMWLVAGLVLLLARFFHCNTRAASLAISFSLFLLFSYGHFATIIWTVRLNLFGKEFGRNLILFPVWCLLLCAGIGSIIRYRRCLAVATRAANTVGMFLVAACLFVALGYAARNRLGRRPMPPVDEQIAGLTAPHPMRDIYYIVLDRYADPQTLDQVFHFDNSDFLEYLAGRGFYIASESFANYPRTVSSLASSLNFRYINYLADHLGENNTDVMPMCRLIRDHRIGRLLKSVGYTYIHFGSCHVYTRTSEIADINFNVYLIPDFTVALYRLTMFYPVGAKLGLFGEHLTQLVAVPRKFKLLQTMPSVDRPLFVFAHMLVPHMPYVFDRNGTPLTQEQKHARSRDRKYIDQLLYTNKCVVDLVDTLLANTEPAPIIVIHSDEGPFPAAYQTSPESFRTYKYGEVSDIDLRQKMGILNALYLPGFPRERLYPSVSPVNIFRLILGHYFGADTPLLQDKHYVVEDEGHPYRLTDVTARLRRPSPPDSSVTPSPDSGNIND